MAYDAVAESLRLIADGLPGGPVRLSRRRRFAPLAVDVDGNVAATRFLRRGVACYWEETHLLVRDDTAGWHRLGSGGSSSGEPWTAEEFARPRAEAGPGAVETNGASSVRNDARRPRWIRAAELVAGRDVAEVVIDGRRRLVVPEHGRLVVVWASWRPPRVSARDSAGNELSTLRLSTSVRLPERYKDGVRP